MADEEEDDAADKPKAAEKPEAAEKPKAAEKKAAAIEPEEPEEKDDAPDKPASKSVEWAIAIGMMVFLLGILFMMIYLMRSARSAVM